jgi:hypothetical protein
LKYSLGVWEKCIANWEKIAKFCEGKPPYTCYIGGISKQKKSLLPMTWIENVVFELISYFFDIQYQVFNSIKNRLTRFYNFFVCRYLD